MKKRTRYNYLAAALLSCAAFAAAHMPAVAAPVDAPRTASDADTAWRWIALSDTPGTCPTLAPAPFEWSAGLLFRERHSGSKMLRFCLYTVDARQPKVSQLEALKCSVKASPCLSRLAPDALAVVYMAGGEPLVKSLLWEDLRNYFLEQSGTPANWPVTQLTPVTRISVLDSTPTTPSPPPTTEIGRSRHGMALLHMAADLGEDIVCISTACVNSGVEIESRIVLSELPCSICPTGILTDVLQGGYMGYISNIAVEIENASDDMFDNPPLGTPIRHIINLSVAWDPLFEPGGGSAQRTVSEAVELSVTKAVCRGALVVAAAGNRVNGPSFDDGPLLPAAWEAQPAPDFAECSSLIGAAELDPLDFPADNSTYRPLVYAIGAVDANNRPLEARPAGEPRLVAYGDHAVADRAAEFAPPVATAVLSGSSVSALAATTAAAIAWQYNPALPAYRLMQLIYDSAKPLWRAADFCAGDGPCDEVRRVSLCRAVEEVCDGGPATCPAALACTDPTPQAPALAIDAIALDPGWNPATDSFGDFDATLTDPTCGEDYTLHYHADDGVPDNPCPHVQFYGVQATPYTDGQPTGQTCPICSTRSASPANLYVEIDPPSMLPGETLHDVILLCGDGNDGYLLTNPLLQSLAADDQFLLDGIPNECRAGGMRLVYRVDTGLGDPADPVSGASPIFDATIGADTDFDGFEDEHDNCINIANPDQRDSNEDGFGNVCDADFDGDCEVSFSDLNAIKLSFFATPGDQGWNPDFDINGDDQIGFNDLNSLKLAFFGPPGASGLATCP